MGGEKRGQGPVVVRLEKDLVDFPSSNIEQLKTTTSPKERQLKPCVGLQFGEAGIL